MGVQDVTALTGTAFDTRGMTADEKNKIHQLLNYPADLILANRWPLAESIYAAAGVSATFRVYPGIGHTITPAMFNDLLEFFRASR